jgi:hypothetical protein
MCNQALQEKAKRKTTMKIKCAIGAIILAPPDFAAGPAGR